MQANGAYVSFEPGARTYWHEHPLLSFWKGKAGLENLKLLYVPAIPLFVRPGVKHWHGATDKSSMRHFAISDLRPDKKTAIWYEPVSEDEYKN